MPKVPEYTPSVSLRPAFRQDFSVRATPDDMGAAVGRGMTQLAAGLNNVGDAMAHVQALENETVARDKRNAFMQAKDQLTYGDGGYFTKEGKDAIDGFDGYKQKLGELKREYGSSLTPAQSALFLKAVAPVETDALRSALRHKAGALKSFIVQSATNGADNFKTEAVQSYGDPEKAQKYMAAGLAEIEGLGEKLGWPKEKLDAEKQTYLSDARKLTALEMSNADPIAALEYVTKHRDQMTPTDHLNTMQRLMRMVAPAITKDAVASSQATGRGAGAAIGTTHGTDTMDAAAPGRTQFAARDLPSQAYGLLGVIAGTESLAYNMLNGGERFNDFSDHPRRQGAGGTTTAAGRYQFIKGTWDRVQQTLGLPDFSPHSQDVGAWWLAQDDYKTRTGRDLSTDLAAGKYAEVRAGLGPTWEGIAKLSDEEFARRMKAGGGAAAAKVTFSPRVEKLLSDLPGDYATRLRETASTGVAQAAEQDQAQLKAQRLAVVDDYRLRIAQEDASLTRDEILKDQNLGNGDKATLLNSYSAKFNDALETRQAVSAFQAGQLAIDPYDSNGKKLVDNVWKSLSASVGKEQLRTSLEDLVRQTGVVPQPVLNAIRGELAGKSPQAVASAAQLAVRLNAIDPAAMERRDGGKEARDTAVMFEHLTDKIGLEPQQAAQRIIDARDPEQAAARAALMKSEPVKKFIDGQATETNVRDVFDKGLFGGFDPKLGSTPMQSAAMVAEYRDILEESLYDTAGNQDTAKALAADRFKRRYGVSEFALGGTGIVTRLPPEITYRAGIDGSHKYIADQLKAALKSEGVAAKEIYLQADAQTERDFNAGRPARYEVWFRNSDGVLDRFHLPFFAVAPTKEEVAADRKARSERRRDINRDMIEAGADDIDLDRSPFRNVFTLSPTGK